MRAPGALRLPAYPYDRLAGLFDLAGRHPEGAVDLSVGTPGDPPPPEVVEALATSGAERGYPSSAGSRSLRAAATRWLRRRFGAVVDDEQVGACVGTKELVAGLPHWLRLRDPSRDTILYPGLSYPTYEMGALLGGCRAVPVPSDEAGHMDLDRVNEEDASRALALWVNSPGNPAGQLDDLGAAAKWGRQRDVVVLSDECYAELTWDGPCRSVLAQGSEGVLAVHSLSKRSNLAGLRVGFYAGDPELVTYLIEIRRHGGLMVPGPVQAAAEAALDDDRHVAAQRRLYRERLERFTEILAGVGAPAPLPGGGLYLWAPVPAAFAAPGGSTDGAAGGGPCDGGTDAGGPRSAAWAFAEWLARAGGVVVSPGDLYGEAGRGHVRVAMVKPMDRLELVARRLAGASGPPK